MSVAAPSHAPVPTAPTLPSQSTFHRYLWTISADSSSEMERRIRLCGPNESRFVDSVQCSHCQCDFYRRSPGRSVEVTVEVYLLPCGHSIHKDCLDPTAMHCPTCRPSDATSRIVNLLQVDLRHFAQPSLQSLASRPGGSNLCHRYHQPHQPHRSHRCH